MTKPSADRRQPWMKWYPADWRADPAVRMCGLAARGLWADMLGLMHEAEPYGHLIVAGRAPTNQQLAALVGVELRAVTAALAELEAAGVFSRTAEGVIFSRRMVRDKAKAEADRANGGRGGNPRLRAADNPPRPAPDNGGVNPPVGDPDKAQKPEARDTSPLRSDGASAPPPPDAGPPPDARTQLFALGVPALRRMTGKTEPAVRSMLGRWLKLVQDDCLGLLRVLVEVENARPADPVPRIEAAVRRLGGMRPDQPRGTSRAGGIGELWRERYGEPAQPSPDGRLVLDGTAEEAHAA